MLTNGDRITGEIKSLQQGQLSLSTDSMGTIRIEWDDIAEIQSEYFFEVDLSSGRRLFGNIETVPETGELAVSTVDGPEQLRARNVVAITPIEDQFLERMSGSLSVGLSYTQASEIAQFNLNGSMEYQGRKRRFRLQGSGIATTEEGERTTSRGDIAGQMFRARSNNWFNAWFASLERNDELGLDLRAGVGGGLGRYLIRTNKSDLLVLGGLLASREFLVGEQDSNDNLEALFTTEYNRYIYDSPKLNLICQLQLYPSLSEVGRLRVQLDITLRYELISDLFLDVSFYDSYDSDPPAIVAENNDYGVVTSLGWSY